MRSASSPTNPHAMQTPAGVSVPITAPLTIIATPMAEMFAVPSAANARARMWSGVARW